VSIDVSVVVSYNVVVMKALENVSTRLLLSVGDEVTRVGQDAHFCYNLLSISHAHSLRVEFFARKYLLETTMSLETRSATISTYQTIRFPSCSADDTKGEMSNSVPRFVVVEERRRSHGGKGTSSIKQ